MIRSAAFVLGLAAAYMVPAAVSAQSAPPTYEADPSVYKIIFQDDNFRVIEATWKVGQTDKPHSHPVPSVIYSLNACTIKLTDANGKSRIVKNKAGDAAAVPIETSHTAKNMGREDCRAVFVERK